MINHCTASYFWILLIIFHYGNKAVFEVSCLYTVDRRRITRFWIRACLCIFMYVCVLMLAHVCVQEGLRCSRQHLTLITSHGQVDWKARGLRRQSVTPVTPKEPTCPISQAQTRTHAYSQTFTCGRLMETAVVPCCLTTVYNTICDHRRCFKAF